MEIRKMLFKIGTTIFFSIVIILLLLYPGIHLLVTAGGSAYNNSTIRTYVLSFSNNPYLFLKLSDFDLSRARSDYYLEDLNMGLALCGSIESTNPTCSKLYLKLDAFNKGIKQDEFPHE